MKCRMFALSLALGALLCLAPSAAALEPQPEVPAPDTAAASQTDAPAAPGTAGKLKLYDVEPKTAAMLMAIVADKMGKPLNELRFISIKEVQ